VPGGNVNDQVVRTVDIAKPAIVRIITQLSGQLTVTFSNGQKVTFPQTAQNGDNGYIMAFSGSGAFISAHGDVLTADHVINPVQDDKEELDSGLQQEAAPDVAAYINQNLNPAQPVTEAQVVQQLANGQLASTPQYGQQVSRVYLSVDFSGPLTVTDFRNIPTTQYANVDQIKKQSPFTEFDIAIIHVKGMDNMPMLQMGNSSAVQQQDKLTVLGFPGNADISNNPTDLLTPSITPVVVSAKKTAPNGSPLLQVTGNVQQGDSGGPALDKQGNVVGIVSFARISELGADNFLRASNSAQQMVKDAGVDTRPSDFQKLWSQSFNDYASTGSGHWHKASQGFQSISEQYPKFKALTPYLEYANAQAKTEPSTPGSTNTNGLPAIGGNSTNTIYIIVGGAVLLLLVIIGVGVGARRKPQPALAQLPDQAYGNFSGPNYPGQQYGSPPPNSLPGYPQQQQGQGVPVGAAQQLSYQSPLGYQQQSPAYRAQPGYPPQSQVSSPQMGYPNTLSPSRPTYQSQVPQPTPSSPRPAPQQSYQPRSASPGSFGSFGAPPSTPGTQDSEATMRRPNPNAVGSPWRMWPCGHTNRSDARFCGTCGESSPPLARRIEQ